MGVEATKKEQVTNDVLPKKSFWGPISSILLSFHAYIIGLALGTLLVTAYPLARGWNAAQTDNWLSSTPAQFWLIFLVDGTVVLLLWWFLRLRSSTFRKIGVKWPHPSDILYAVGGFVSYFLLYVLIAVVAGQLFPSIDFEQNQQIGFETAKTAAQLALVFVSLVVIPPIVEEILFRGFLYKGLRTKWPKWLSTLVVSVLFAIAHLQFGSGAPLLWVAAIDTFALSLVLVYLREKTNGLSAPILLHAFKNAIAFTLLFIIGV